jgi:hypothetical protein
LYKSGVLFTPLGLSGVQSFIQNSLSVSLCLKKLHIKFITIF